MKCVRQPHFMLVQLLVAPFLLPLPAAGLTALRSVIAGFAASESGPWQHHRVVSSLHTPAFAAPSVPPDACSNLKSQRIGKCTRVGQVIQRYIMTRRTLFSLSARLSGFLDDAAPPLVLVRAYRTFSISWRAASHAGHCGLEIRMYLTVCVLIRLSHSKRCFQSGSK